MSTTKKPLLVRLSEGFAGLPLIGSQSNTANAEATPPEMQEFKRNLFNNKKFGSPGTTIYAGYVQEEYLTALQGYAAADKFDEMRRSDAQVTMLIAAVNNSIKSANWDIEIGTEDTVGQMVKEFVEYLLFEGMDEDNTWAQFLNESLTVIIFGHAVHEMIDKVVVGHPRWGTHNAIKQLGWRNPRTLHRFNIDPPTGKLLTISQQAYGDLEAMVDIPAENCLIYTIGREGANWQGISMLRPCYGNYFRKDFYLKMNAIGMEKYAVPTPTVKIPAGAQNGEQYNAMIEAMEAYTQHESNYLVMPLGWEIVWNNGIYDPEKAEASIDAEDRRMTKAFLANFLELGIGSSGGAYALSQDLSDFFLGGIKHIANTIAEGINKTVIPRMVKMNFGPQQKYPKLKVSGIDDKIGQEFATILKDLASVKYIKPDDQLEEHIRKRMGLPKMSLIGQREQPLPLAGAFGAPPPGEEEVDDQGNPPSPPMKLSERIKLEERRRLLREK